jgi:YegS/Rv2252/BmrU family lipid kinase
MKIAVILNGISLQKKKFYHEIFPVLQQRFETSVYETASRNDAVVIAAKVATQNVDLIVAAGGDGTVFQVANGLLQEQNLNLPVMGVIPLGSGNDFSRGLNIPTESKGIIDMIEKMDVITMDVGCVHFTTDDNQNGRRYFLNVVDVGMGPEVVRKVLSSGRPFGSSVAYYISIISTFLFFKPQNLKAVAPSWTWEGKMRTFAVANGKFYGHGLCIAPSAKVDDGVFEVFACGDASALDFIMQSTPLRNGKRLNHPKVSYYYTEHVELTSDELCMIEADGELLGKLPAHIEMAPVRIKFLVSNNT